MPEILKSKENLPAAPVGFLSVFHRGKGMKWDKPPVWPVAIPAFLGVLVGTLDLYLGLPDLFEQTILLPILVVMGSSLLLIFLPKNYGSGVECAIGFNVMVLVAVIPQLILPIWFIIVIIFWLSQSLYVWKSNYPPFRLGIWLGAGAMSGLFLGSFVAANLLA